MFYAELDATTRNNVDAPPSIDRATLVNGIKQTFLVLINLTLYNGDVSRQLANDSRLVDLLFECVARARDGCLADAEQFDVLITAFGVLLNMFDGAFGAQAASLPTAAAYLIKRVQTLKTTSFDIVLNVGNSFFYFSFLVFVLIIDNHFCCHYLFSVVQGEAGARVGGRNRSGQPASAAQRAHRVAQCGEHQSHSHEL